MCRRNHFKEALHADGVADADDRADFLLSSFSGALTQTRLLNSATAAGPTAAVVIELLESWAD